MPDNELTLTLQASAGYGFTLSWDGGTHHAQDLELLFKAVARRLEEWARRQHSLNAERARDIARKIGEETAKMAGIVDPCDPDAGCGEPADDEPGHGGSTDPNSLTWEAKYRIALRRMAAARTEYHNSNGGGHSYMDAVATCREMNRLLSVPTSWDEIDDPDPDPADEPIRIPYRPTSAQLCQAAMAIGPGERVVVERGRPEDDSPVGLDVDAIDRDDANRTLDETLGRPLYWATIRETAEQLTGHPVEDRVVRCLVGWCAAAFYPIPVDSIGWKRGSNTAYHVANALANYTAAPLLSERLADEMGVES